MKFVNYLEGIANISIYPLISLLVFFFFFVALTLYVVLADKNKIEELSRIPLDNDDQK